MNIKIIKRFNAELELLIGNIRSFGEKEDEKLLRERQLNYMRFNFECFLVSVLSKVD